MKEAGESPLPFYMIIVQLIIKAGAGDNTDSF